MPAVRQGIPNTHLRSLACLKGRGVQQLVEISWINPDTIFTLQVNIGMTSPDAIKKMVNQVIYERYLKKLCCLL
jgi:hypothetical protein